MKSRQTSTRRSVDCDATVFPIIGTFCTRFSNRWKLFQPFFQSLEKPLKTLILAAALGFFGSASAHAANQSLVYVFGQVETGLGEWATYNMTETSGVWRVTVQYIGTTAWHEFVFGNSGWATTWKTYSGGSHDLNDNEQRTMYADGDNNTWASFIQNMYYTYTIKDVPNNTAADALKMPTTNAPISIASVSDNANFIGDGPVTVTITTSAGPSGERIFVRYTTDGWTSSSFVEASGSGTAWTAAIPDQGDGTAVQYYVFTTTIASPNHANADLQTIAYGNNNGSNYSYVQPPTVIAKVTFEDYSIAQLNGQSGASDVGLSGAWYGDGTNAQIAATTIVYQAGSVRINGGTNALFIRDGAATTATNGFSSSINYGAGVTRYFGYLIKAIGTIGSDDQRYLSLDNNNSPGNSISVGIDNSISPGTNHFFVQLNTNKQASAGLITLDQTYYLVLKLQGSASAWTNAVLYVNPTNTAAEQAAYTIPVGDDSFAFPLTCLIVKQNMTSTKSFYVDQITFGKTWGDVVYSNESPALVVLYSFSVADEGGAVVVRWRTASENDTIGFYVERLDGEQYVRLNSEPIFSPQNGMGNSYSFTDETAVPGNTYTYRLIEIEGDGGIETYGPFDRTASALQLQSPITAGTDGMVIRWLSREDEAYNILRATDLLTGFETIASAIPATPPENAYTDTVSGASGFYRIEVNLDE